MRLHSLGHDHHNGYTRQQAQWAIAHICGVASKRVQALAPTAKKPVLAKSVSRSVVDTPPWWFRLSSAHDYRKKDGMASIGLDIT